MTWSTTDISIANTIENAFKHSGLRGDAQFVVLELLHQAYLKRKKTPVHLPPRLSQHVVERLRALSSITTLTPAEEASLATIEKSFKELSPAAQENVAKVYHLSYLATMRVTRKQLAQLTRKLRG